MMEIKKDLVTSAFRSYTAAFDSSNLQIANKIRHTWHVADNCSVIASSLAADAPLAWLIGVLHDIGRFEQIRVIHGYDDNLGLDHGDYGVKLLFEDGLIRRFLPDPSADEIISQGLNPCQAFFSNKIKSAPALEK